jgi:hypothetical protein
VLNIYHIIISIFPKSPPPSGCGKWLFLDREVRFFSEKKLAPRIETEEGIERKYATPS